MSNEIDLENDAEWQALVAGFRTHFWQVRVPNLLTAWAEAREHAVSLWSRELKRAIHGIAGSAGLIGFDAIGEQARAAEQAWDGETLSRPELLAVIDALVQAIAIAGDEREA